MEKTPETPCLSMLSKCYTRNQDLTMLTKRNSTCASVRMKQCFPSEGQGLRTHSADIPLKETFQGMEITYLSVFLESLRKALTPKRLFYATSRIYSLYEDYSPSDLEKGVLQLYIMHFIWVKGV